MNAQTNVWLVEDNSAFRTAVQRVIDGHAGFICGGVFRSIEEMEMALRRGQPVPRIVLLDVGLPGMNGIDGIARIREYAPAAAVIILTVFEDDDKIFRAICAGAAGYMLKSSSAEEIIQAIESVLAGGAPMTPLIARRVLTMFSRLNVPRVDYGLTDREKEILELVVEGLIKKEIGARLELSVHTVDSHLRHIYEKLQVNTRTGAVAKALKERLI